MRPALALALLAACGSGSETTRVLMDFDRPTSFYDAPFPSDDLRSGDGIDLSGFPNPDGVDLVEDVRALLAGADGFATTGGVFLRTTAPVAVDELPDIAGSAADGATVFLIDIDAASPEAGRRIPVEVRTQEFEELYGAANLLTLVPVQGFPLRPSTRYAAVVTTALHDADGAPLGTADPAALAIYGDAAAQLAGLGLAADQLAGIAVFTTGDPVAEMLAVRDAALARPLPQPTAAFTRTDLFDDFCVYQTTLPMPVYQSGVPPYDNTGGTWEFDGDGAPIFQRDEEARIVVTLPRAPLPADGYPLVVFVRTGGGGDRPMVDRGQHDADGNTIEPGEGPARYFARAGFAALEVDGPHGGLRNITGGDEQFLIFNVQNLGALRDNVRQSALELAVIANVAVDLELDASDCPPAGTSDPGPTAVGFDGDHVALMGHSMGATIGPLVVAAEPRYAALILDGAGGSWIENIMYKQKPVALHGLFERVLGHPLGGLRGDDPALTLAQWALESADPPPYARRILAEPATAGGPRHVLMHQGIVDSYILPRIANATSLSLQLDLAGPAEDTIDDPRLADQLPLGPLLPLAGRAAIALPAAGNAERTGGIATAVVVQHAEDGVEDGHEVTFQTDAPKHQYQCFLASWLAGTPSVPAAADRDAPCPE